MTESDREADDQRAPDKKQDGMTPDENKNPRSEKRAKDETLVQNLRELYKPVLDEPVPDEFLAILRRKRGPQEKN